MRRSLWYGLAVVVPAFVFFSGAAWAQRATVEALLVGRGIDPAKAQSILCEDCVEVRPDIVIKNLFYSSPKGSAERPDVMRIPPAQIQRSAAFMLEHAGTLAAVEARYGTSPRIITAILLIESRLGTYPMPYNVATAYANLAFLLDPDYLLKFRNRYVDEYPQLKEEKTYKRIRKRANWALGELAHLIYIADHLNIDPLSIAGSFAGAMGPAQFIPSSFWLFGVDGDEDGLADPFNLTDAKFSMGYYLKKFGWRESASDEQKRKAIWYYNRSEVYVNTVMMVYEKLR